LCDRCEEAAARQCNCEQLRAELEEARAETRRLQAERDDLRRSGCVGSAPRRSAAQWRVVLLRWMGSMPGAWIDALASRLATEE